MVESVVTGAHSQDEREAVYRVLREMRDVRSDYLPQPSMMYPRAGC